MRILSVLNRKTCESFFYKDFSVGYSLKADDET